MLQKKNCLQTISSKDPESLYAHGDADSEQEGGEERSQKYQEILGTSQKEASAPAAVQVLAL